MKGRKTGIKKRGKKGKKGKGSKGKKGRKGKKKKDGKGKKKKDGEGKKKKNGKGKQGKRPKKNGFGKSERQTAGVPAACSADKCTDTDYVNLFNAYKKVIKSQILNTARLGSLFRFRMTTCSDSSRGWSGSMTCSGGRQTVP